MPIITIQMRGGVVQTVEGMPPAITIRIQSESEVKEFTAPPSTLPLPTRNTKLLREIISTVQHLIQYPAIALCLPTGLPINKTNQIYLSRPI